MEVNAEKDKVASGCCGRLKTELSSAYPLFSLDEQNGTVIDVKATFAPGVSSDSNRLGWTFFLVRLAMIGWISGAGVALSLQSFGSNIMYWPIYFTHLTAILTLTYFLLVCSLQLLALLGQGKKHLTQSSSKGPDSKLTTFIWTLYSTGVPANLIVVINYWLMVYDPERDVITLYSITMHGISCALMIIDGVLIAGIPIRAKHFAFSFTWGCLLLLWSVIHSLSGIGDGVWEGEDEDHSNEDDQLYAVLDWKHDPMTALIVALATLFALLPTCFVIGYIFALFNRKTLPVDSVKNASV